MSYIWNHVFAFIVLAFFLFLSRLFVVHLERRAVRELEEVRKDDLNNGEGHA